MGVLINVHFHCCGHLQNLLVRVDAGSKACLGVGDSPINIQICVDAVAQDLLQQLWQCAC